MQVGMMFQKITSDEFSSGKTNKKKEQEIQILDVFKWIFINWILKQF